jgi:hypothetical protein
MYSPIEILFTSTNYFSWKSHMDDVLRSIRLYRITFGKEQEPTDDDKYSKWVNKNDKACGLINMSISPNLRFHLQGIEGPDKAWENIESVFGKYNIIWAHQIENKIMTLIPSDFLALKTIYLSSKHLEFYVKSVK